MNASVAAGHDEPERREPVLDTVDRVSELCFGLFMALTFVGAVSVVTAGQDAGRKMLYSALGCNLAWGLADAVMFLVRTLTNRGKRLSLALAIKREQDTEAAIRTLHDALPTSMRGLVAAPELELIRARIGRPADAAAPPPALCRGLRRRGGDLRDRRAVDVSGRATLRRLQASSGRADRLAHPHPADALCRRLRAGTLRRQARLAFRLRHGGAGHGADGGHRRAGRLTARATGAAPAPWRRARQDAAMG